MRIAVLDDEPYSLNIARRAVEAAAPDSEIRTYRTPDDALGEISEGFSPDVVFTDIEMPGMNGVTLAKKIKSLCPLTNIVFCTGYSEYMEEAFRLHASGYLLKPISEDGVKEELENLRNPVGTEVYDGLYVQTFGNFEVFYNGVPIPFGRKKSKELLAYLVDRHGATVTRQELASVLFESGTFSRTEQNYLSRIAKDLVTDLQKAGVSDLLRRNLTSYYLDISKIRCDSYEYMDGNAAAINCYRGEYMEQYSWAEYLKQKFNYS